MAEALLKFESTLTERYQTTVPREVRQALGLSKHDKLSYSIKPDGSVIVAKATDEKREGDPILGTFLAFLANDIALHPDQVRGLPASLVARAQELVQDVEIDLDAPVEDDE